MQTNKFQADAKIRVVLDYLMGRVQRKNKILVSLHVDMLVSLEASTLQMYIFAYKVEFSGCFDESTRYPNNKRYSHCLCPVYIYTPIFS